MTSKNTSSSTKNFTSETPAAHTSPNSSQPNANNAATALPDGNSYVWTFLAEDLTSIMTTWGAGSLHISSPSTNYDAPEDKNIVAIFMSENSAAFENPPIIDYTNGVLSIESATTPMDLISTLFSDISKTRLTIEIPPSVAQNLDSIDIDAASGNLDLVNLASDYTSLEISSGNVNLNNFNTNALNLDVTSGTVSFDGQITDTLTTNLATGNLSISSNTCPGETFIDMTSGHIDLMLPKDCALKTYVDKISGSFENQLTTASTEDSATGQLSADIASGSVVVKPLESA